MPNQFVLSRLLGLRSNQGAADCEIGQCDHVVVTNSNSVQRMLSLSVQLVNTIGVTAFENGLRSGYFYFSCEYQRCPTEEDRSTAGALARRSSHKLQVSAENPISSNSFWFPATVTRYITSNLVVLLKLASRIFPSKNSSHGCNATSLKWYTEERLQPGPCTTLGQENICKCKKSNVQPFVFLPIDVDRVDPGPFFDG